MLVIFLHRQVSANTPTLKGWKTWLAQTGTQSRNSSQGTRLSPWLFRVRYMYVRAHHSTAGEENHHLSFSDKFSLLQQLLLDGRHAFNLGVNLVKANVLLFYLSPEMICWYGGYAFTRMFFLQQSFYNRLEANRNL